MVNIRRAIFSCDLFGGFSVLVDIDEMKGNEQIVRHAYDSLHIFLKTNCLHELIMRLDTRAYRIRTDFADVLQSTASAPVFVCHHHCERD